MRPGTIRIVLSYAQLQWLAAAKIQCDTSLLPMNEKDAQLLDTLEAVTKQMAVGVTRCSRDFRYLWANQAYANWIQHPLNEIVERPILEVLGRNAFEALLPYFNQVLSGQTVRYEQETNSQGV